MDRKHLLTTAAVAAAVAALTAGLPALSAPSVSIPRRMAALETKVKKLKLSVAKLNAAVKYDEACLAPVYGTARYTGYLYTPDGGVTTVATTALDVTDTGETPQVWIQAVDGKCVTTSGQARGFHAAKLRRAFPAHHPTRQAIFPGR